jgi:hypothetical protein
LFDVLILGGGVSGMSCSLVLGSPKQIFCYNKKNWHFTHQSIFSKKHFNNAYGIPPGTWADLMKDSITHLSETYPHIVQILMKST